MSRSILAVLSVAALGLSCDTDLDTLDGHKLGKATSAVFSRDRNGHVMLVLSDLPDLCESLVEADAPSKADFWVLSAWTSVGVDESSEYAVEAYVAVSTNQVIEEYQTEAGGVEFSQVDADELAGVIDITFPGNEQIKARFEAEFCDSDLFVGMY
jgi:hypothetical protein